MSDHDLVEEMRGYRAEMARYGRSGRTDRADAVREQIGRVVVEGVRRAEILRARADDHEANGQDLLAAQSRIQARELLAGLGVADGQESDGGAGRGELEDTGDSTPRETATPKKRRGRRTDEGGEG
ncbi:MAG TPA: hypothetical protein VIR27_16085 [Mycobacteriales bacterium]|jgi:hypothetical protein